VFDVLDLVGFAAKGGADLVGQGGVGGVLVGLGEPVAEFVEGPLAPVGVGPGALLGLATAGPVGLGPCFGQPLQVVIAKTLDLVPGVVGVTGDGDDVARLVVGVLGAELVGVDVQ